MAPIPQYFPHKGREAVVNFQLISDAVLQYPPIFKGGEPLKKMQSSRFMRCSSLSSEEESFQLFGHDRKESFRSLVVSVKIKTPVSSFAVCNNANTPNTDENENENRKKAKSKVALELELEKNLHY